MEVQEKTINNGAVTIVAFDNHAGWVLQRMSSDGMQTARTYNAHQLVCSCCCGWALCSIGRSLRL